MSTSQKPVARRGTLPRKDAFFGLHFDFHAGADCKDVGARVSDRMVESIIDAAKPDYLQCDCKGHPGIASYPTQVGYPAPGFVRDPLKIWRRVTAKHGVGLFMHFSGVFDTAAIAHHPDWARINEKGERDPNNTSVFGPYVDKLLIPQLKELRERYGVDGVWLDGDCWATCQDYSPHVLEVFKAETGFETIPRKKEDPGFREFIEFCREGFRAYLRHYVDALHAFDPAYQIASNWAFSGFMPEPVCANVDFISGDYNMGDSVNSARHEGRCMAPQGVAWDLMAWSFVGHWGEGVWSTKTAVQVCQEAAVVLALGGGFQLYLRQNRDASVSLQFLPLIREVAAFCRERQAVCHKAKPVPQVALFLSSAGFYHNSTCVFSPGDGLYKGMQGIMAALLHGQHSVEILSEHHLHGRLADYPLVVIPEWDFIAPAFLKELEAYVRGGGSILCIGPKAARLFRKLLNVRFGKEHEAKTFHIVRDGLFAGIKARTVDVVPGKGVRIAGMQYRLDDPDTATVPMGTVTRVGKGRIAAVYADVGVRYSNSATTVLRDYLNDLVRDLFPEPLVEVVGSHSVDVCVNEKAGRLMINLVNTSGPHADPHAHVFDTVPPVENLTVRVRTPRRPRRVLRHPGARPMTCHFSKGVTTVVVDRLEMHDILEIDGAWAGQPSRERA